MKTMLLVILLATSALVRGAALTATITEQTKMEVTRGKGTISLKAGTVVEVVSHDGDLLGIVYHSITGFVPAAKTDFKGEVPKSPERVAKPEEAPKSTEAAKAAPSAKPAEQKPAEQKPAAAPNREEPTTNYGKMVKKARDNEAKHKENLVDPTDDTSSAAKKE